MNRISLSWAKWVIRYRVAVLLLTLLALVLAPLSFNRLYHDNSNESYFLPNDPTLQAFDRMVENFGDPEYLLVAIPARQQDDDVFNVQTVTIIHELTEFLENHRHVTQVRSLSKYQYTHDDAGMMATDDLFEDIDYLAEQPELLDQARAIMAGERLALELLITRDFKNTQIVARSVYKPGENAHNVELVQELREFIDEQAYRELGFDIHMAGVPVIGERFETLTQNDMAWINPTMGVIMLVILFVVFRSFFAMSVPMVVILTTMLLVTGIQAWLGFPFTAVNSALIPTVIILCIGTCVHVLVEFFQFRYAGESPERAAVETVNDLFFAVLFTCVTTAIGFIALSVTELKPVREFAILAAIAPMLIFMLAMTTLPAILSYIPWVPRNKRHRLEPGHQKSVEQMLTDDTVASSPTLWLTHRIPLFTLRNRKAIAVVGVLVTLFSLYSISYIRVDSNIVNYFKKSSWVNQDLFYFNDTFKGISNMELVIDTGEEGGVKNPQILQSVDQLQEWLKTFPEMGKPTSVIDFYKQINQSLNENKPEYFLLPTSREMAAQFLLLYENTGPNEDLSDLKDFNERFLRVQTPVVNMDEVDTSRLMHEIKDGLANKFSELNIEMSGNVVMNNAQNRYVNNGMFKSFGIAILCIGICFLVLFRSFKYGAIALVPSIVPILLTGGLVSFAGIPMDLGTMIVGAMTIGIAVDDAIHLMSRYLLMRRRGYDVYQAVQYAMNSSGRAVVLTSIILVTGFSVMLLGSFVSYIYVGLFSAMIMLLALVGDIFFMPALLYLFDGDKKYLEKITKDADVKDQRKHTSTANEVLTKA
ncbi:hypothetical protein SAMN02745866_03310 [Alteromonadaceae bacterium Bs31]|nr:hypothetical protein SAMN02745866_03310 [Alteromonadaceae bacterium Bs31]